MRLLIYNINFNTIPFVYNDVLNFSEKHDVSVLCETFNIDNRFNSENIITFKRENKSVFSKINSSLISHDLRLSYKSNNLKKQFADIINNVKPDIIQCHFGDEALILLDNINVTNIPIVIMFHGYDASAWIRNKTYIRKYKKILNNNNISAICCSNDMKQRLIAVGFPKSKLSVIYYGVDVDYFKPINKIISEEKVFTQISTFRKKKGIEQTVKAFKLYIDKYKNKNFKLVLAGDGALKNEIEKLAKELGIDKYIEYAGKLNLNEVRDLLNKSDYFIHHSVTNIDGDMEGIPNAIIEAMAMELPVLSTFHSGIPELVENNRNGILVKENDIEAYADSINEIINNKDIRGGRDKVVR